MNEPSGYYESNTTLAQYLEFHFGESWHGEANFRKNWPMPRLERWMAAPAAGRWISVVR